MNERIKELAKDCGYQHIPLTSLDKVGDFDYFDIERFAELIVKECCDVLYDNELGGYRVDYVLKEYFGVEE